MPPTVTELRVTLKCPPQEAFEPGSLDGNDHVGVDSAPNVSIHWRLESSYRAHPWSASTSSWLVRHVAGDEGIPHERLLRDAIPADAMLFVRHDSVEAAWHVVDPAVGAMPVHEHEPGTWRPIETDTFIVGDGGRHNPTLSSSPVRDPVTCGHDDDAEDNARISE
jgi:glucose-6-phosphate 1-dehydrogenase